MASICNVGIPLWFAFGPGEDKTIYEMFYDIDLVKYTYESDRDSSLMALAANLNMEHLSCNHAEESSEFSQQ